GRLLRPGAPQPRLPRVRRAHADRAARRAAAGQRRLGRVVLLFPRRTREARSTVLAMSEQTVFPALRYTDAKAAIDWLGRAFGFEVHVSYDEGDVVHHAELKVPGGMIMLGSVRGDSSDYQAVAPPPGSAAIYVVVEDTDAHHARAKEAGAEIVTELH